MEIIQSFYYSPNEQRQQEIEYTLTENLNKSFVNKIHLFIEDKDIEQFNGSQYASNTKINVVHHNSQPTYPELFHYGCTLNNVICCICNSDIEFRINNDDLFLLNRLNDKRELYLLTRHEHDLTKPQIDTYRGSHDAIVFHSNTFNKAIENMNLSYINYIQNTSGIEALLTIFFIEHITYKVTNPCYQIILVHNHRSQVRLWNAVHKAPVGYTHPTNIGLPGVHNSHMIRPCTINN